MLIGKQLQISLVPSYQARYDFQAQRQMFQVEIVFVLDQRLLSTRNKPLNTA